jgi:hypothetical protein
MCDLSKFASYKRGDIWPPKEFVISLFPKEITVHSGIVWRDKIYGDSRQMCERVKVYLLSNINFLDDQKWNISFLH